MLSSGNLNTPEMINGKKMKKLALLITVVLMSGCSRSMFTMSTNATDEQKHKFELDNTNCKKLTTSQAGETTENKHGKDYDECMTRQGWSNQSLTNNNNAYKKEIENQASYFFQRHPEYMRSKEKESQLYTEFQNVLAEPKNQALSLYQMLQVAHAQIVEN